MPEQNDRRGIGWVRGEVERLLESVRDTLQRRADNEPDANLAESVVALHQCWGALTIVEAHAAADVLRAMETLAEALRDDFVPDPVAGIDALMHAVVEVPSLLAALETGEPTGSFSRLLGALRAAIGADPGRQDREPDLRVLRATTPAQVIEQFAGSDAQGVARRVRAGFQQCLVNVLRGSDPTRTGLRLMKIVAAVQRICRGAPHERLWWLFGALVEAVQHVPGTLQRRGVQALRRMDNELRTLATHGAEALRTPPPEDLAREILTLLSELGVRSQRIDAALDAFGLGAGNDSLARVGREATASAARELVVELGALAARLDTYAASELRNVADLDGLRAPLRRIAGTLAMLGLGALESVISEQYARVDLAVARGRLADDELMSLAESMMGVEEELRVIGSTDSEQGTTAEARKSVVREARIGLDEVKLAIVDFIGKKWDHSVIETVPALLRAVRGGLEMLDLARPAILVGECRRYVAEEVLGNRNVPEWEQLDLLADAITSLDYYLERFTETRGKSDERVLELAWESVYSLAQGIAPSLPAAVGAEARYPSFLAPQHLPKAVSWPEPEPSEAPTAGDLAAMAWNQAAAAQRPVGAGPAVAFDERDSVGEPAADPVAAAVPAPEPLHIDLPNDRDILPVFEEETAEVIAAIDAHLPTLRTTPDDRTALTELRRAFHTLKGGARMIGANALGELGWSVERVLNPLLEGEGSLQREHVDLIVAAREAIPEFVAAFGAERPPNVDARALQAFSERAQRAGPTGPVSPVIDEALLDVFRAEASGLLADLDDALGRARADDRVVEAITRAAHTLRGSAAAADVGSMFPLADALDRFLKTRRVWRDDTLDLVRRGVLALRLELARVPAARPLPESVQACDALLGSPQEVSPPPAAETAAPLLDRWARGDADESELARRREELAAIAAQQESAEVTEVALALVGVYDVIDLTAPPAATDLPALRQGHAALDQLLAAQAAGATLQAEAEVVRELRAVEDRLIERLSFGDAAATTPEPRAASVLAPSSAAPAVSTQVQLPGDLDRELLVVFHEEASELLESIEARIEAWRAEPNNQVHREHVLRALHTLKGGARLAGLAQLGDETHALEARVQQFADDAADIERSLTELTAGHDGLARWLGPVREYCFAPSRPTIAEPASTLVVSTALPTPSATVAEASSDGTPAPWLADQAEREPAPAAIAGERQAQEMIRVASSLLEQLVDLAGESAITRARISEVIGEITHVLEEMGMTVRRVRDQVRRLEIETETQVLSRRERVDRPDYAEFDPLEMDRYSQLQQLTRGLTEASSDLLDLQETIRSRSREADGLLAQQARLNTELQEGLMRTRMVPFTRLAPRLSRIVRTIGQELGKQVQLEVSAAAGELDRSVLERMIPPLEHMLRNAVDHGIETPARRRELGKAETGRIQIRLQREASEIVIEIADDGAGIDPEAVRRKAIDRGLIAADARVSDRDVLAFIFRSGFSTAAAVTQISGRGVGMDVVAAEVKQLGGSIDLQSQRGRGTRFTIRLPFTVSVNRALMVSIGEDTYAVPLNTIEGIVRATPAELLAAYGEESPAFDYAGMDYRLGYLGSLLGRDHLVRGDVSSLPVLLTRSGEDAMAVHVDAVHGSREIVVKALGPQFAGVSGVSGATLLGDGSVVVILDLPGLIRRRAHTIEAVEPVIAPVAERSNLCVMVVDDSVTVRKVTSRLLERQGFEVLLAKDGLEAVAQLQERRPDVMLLDIEMPRMDGFEVAQHVRHDDRLAGLPIIMISSRAGQKHRERATQIGVNRFIGKPFQESDLLGCIEELTSVEAVAAAALGNDLGEHP